MAQWQILDTETGIWSTGTPMPTPRSEASAVVVDGLIYVLGGNIEAGSPTPSVYYATVEVYNPATDNLDHRPQHAHRA